MIAWRRKMKNLETLDACGLILLESFRLILSLFLEKNSSIRRMLELAHHFSLFAPINIPNSKIFRVSKLFIYLSVLICNFLHF